MSENEHLTSIRKLTKRIGVGILTAPRYSYVDGDADKDVQAVAAIERHADELAQQLAEAEARTDRWKRLAIASMAVDESVDEAAWETALGEYDIAMHELRKHGDLPDSDGGERDD